MTAQTGDDGAMLGPPSSPFEWTVIGTSPDEWTTPVDVDHDAAGWMTAFVPGTVAQAVVEARGSIDGVDVDGSDWWFRGAVRELALDPMDDSPWRLTFDGIATLAEIHVPGHPVVPSVGMWRRHELVVDALAPGSTVFVVCRALAPRLGKRRRPSARWRSSLVPDGELRWWRTSLVGRIPSWSPAPPAVGPHGDVAVDVLRPGAMVDSRVHHDPIAQVLRVDIDLVSGSDEAMTACLAGETHALSASSIDPRAVSALSATSDATSATVPIDRWTASLPTAGLARWWPHTHGDPVLHELEVTASFAGAERVVLRRRVGFRQIEVDYKDGGFGLVVNGRPVFARGACWVPIDPLSFRNDRESARDAVAQMAAAGANLLRVTGTATYEDDVFHEACDELGVMVWQDLMFSNFDIPANDPDVEAEIEAELSNVLPCIAAHASTAIICGGNEVEQQAAMMGADPSCWQEGLFQDLVPRLVHEHAPGLTYVSNSPTGGAVPFRVSEGVAHYFGVGGYRRPLADVRSAGVRFASECLAFANVPEPEATETLLASGPVGSAAWKQSVARDRGASWDFEDVRDTYVAELFDVDPGLVRAHDPMRYLDLGRMAAGEAMAQVFGFWRTRRAACGGGIVLQARDWRAGSGWGIVDADGGEKSVWWYLRRAWAARSVLVADDGLDGLTAHIVNDRAETLHGSLHVQRWLGERAIEAGAVAVLVEGGATGAVHLDAVIGGFRDLGWAYRFGPPGHDAVVVELRDEDDSLVNRVVHLLPHSRVAVGHPHDVDLDVKGRTISGDAREVELQLSVSGGPAVVAVEAAGWSIDDNYVVALPGLPAMITLKPVAPAPASFASARVVAGRSAVRARLGDTG